MNEDIRRCVGSAAVAAWWTILVASLFFLFQWLAYLVIMSNRPAWVLALWGPRMSWETVQPIWLWFMGAFKMAILLMIAGALWLSLWARRLRT